MGIAEGVLRGPERVLRGPEGSRGGPEDGPSRFWGQNWVKNGQIFEFWGHFLVRPRKSCQKCQKSRIFVNFRDFWVSGGKKGSFLASGGVFQGSSRGVQSGTRDVLG